MTVDYLFQWSLKLTRKSQSGGLTDVEFAYHFNDAQASYMDDLVGRFQTKNTGKEGANTGLIENETVIQKLAPFITNVLINGTSGVYPKPSDLIYALALRMNNYKVFNISHDKIYAVFDDVIDPPSVTNNVYYYVEYKTGYKVLPTSVVSQLELDYVAKPQEVFWNYTLDGNSRKAYSSSGSVHPLWDDNSCREILKRMLKTLGVSLKDQDFEGFGTQIQTIGE